MVLMDDKLANNFQEVIFLGLPGPTHNYGGLSADNVASSRNQGSTSSPRDAALQVAALARLLLSMGLTVGILPPQLRPHVKELKKHFPDAGDDIIEKAAREHPALLEAMSSSSAMWVANAATVGAGPDTGDHYLRLVVANLHTNIHRRIEALTTYLTLRQIFAQVPRAVVDLPLDAHQGYRDEGAANHMRMAPHHAAAGLNIFVYGTDGSPSDPKTARQTLDTSREVMSRLKLSDENSLFIKQNPQAVFSGVFHNDVIAVANENFLLVHEDAYALGTADIDYIAENYETLCGTKPVVRVIRRSELSMEEAIDTYFFNSQLITLPGGGMALIAPSDTRDRHEGKAWALLEMLLREKTNPLTRIESLDLHQSMRNGGGPACLRLRVPMDEQQISALKNHNRVLMDEAKIATLEETIRRTYPASLTAADINYALYLQCQEVLQALGICLGLDLSSA